MNLCILISIMANCHCVITIVVAQDFFNLHKKRKKEKLWFQHCSGQSKLRTFNFKLFSGKIKAIFQCEVFVKCDHFILMWGERLCSFSVVNTNSLTSFFLSWKQFVKLPLKLILELFKSMYLVWMSALFSFLTSSILFLK